MKNSKRPDSISWTRALALIAISAVAMAGCSGDTPTAPGGFEPTATPGSMLVDDTHGAIDGVVFADANQNGVRDPDEVGLSGLTVDLGYPTGATASAVTDAEGHYFFDDLSPAFYVVTAPVVADWMQTTQANVMVRVVAAAVSTVDHGLYSGQTEPGPGSLSGTVFDDANQNGIQDAGEAGLGGLDVEVVDSAAMTSSATTDAEGHYSFPDLAVGSYTVNGPAVDGRIATSPASVSTDVVAEQTTTVDFGLYLEPVLPDTGSLSGTVFDDMNGNGLQDAGEPGLAGLDVELVDSGAMATSATTDADGHYAFADVAVGSYTVNGPTVEGWTATTGTSVNSEVLADATTTVDFGLAMEESGDDEFATIAGVVFEDLDGDGMRGPDEPGLGGVMVRLSSRNTPRDADMRRGFGIHRYAMTGPDGAYAFEDVEPGDWRVSASTRHGRRATSDSSLDFTVFAGDEVDDADFGMSRR